MAVQYVKRAEAMRILGVGSTKVHQLIATKQLPAKLVDKPGECRYWAMKLADVLRLKEHGFLQRKPARQKIRIAWERAHGPIPEGFTVLPLDGNRDNVSLPNLVLKPLASRLKRASLKKGRRTRGPKRRNVWTPEVIAKLKREFKIKRNIDLAQELNVCLASVVRKARLLKLRKDTAALKARGSLNALPIGTERVHDRRSNIVLVKVSMVGKFHGEQWRPKQAVIWEQANRKKLPHNARVIFKDGNKRNFDPRNLQAFMSREEYGAVALARFHAVPKRLQKLFRAIGKAKRIVQEKREERSDEPAKTATPVARTARRSGICTRWTAAMDEILYRDYPNRSISQVLSQLPNVSTSALRQRARRLQIRRLPEAMIAEARAKYGIEASLE